MSSSEILPPLFQIEKHDIRDFTKAWNLPAFELNQDSLIVGSDSWLGPDDLSGTFQIGWCQDGLLMRAQIRDDEVVTDLPDDRLFLRDSVELLFAPPADSQDQFDFGPQVQIVLAAPATDGSVRHAIYCQNPPPDDTFQAAGRLVTGGYELQILLRKEFFGRSWRCQLGSALRFTFHVNDWDHRDDPDSIVQARVMALNGVLDCLRPENWYTFGLTAPFSPQADYDLTPFCKPLPVPRLVIDGFLKVATPRPARFELFDEEDGRLLATSPETQDACMPCKEGTFLKLVARLRLNNGLGGHLQYNKLFNATKIVDEVAPLVRDATNPDRQAQALGILSALEWHKVPRLPFTNPQQELAWRRKRLAGKDVADAPGRLRFLNLMGESDGLATVAFSRETPELATLTVAWGTLPVVYATMRCFPAEEDAAAFVARQLAFKTRVESRKLPGFEEVWLTRGHVPGDAYPTDLDVEHLVTVTCRRNPKAILRMLPEDALALKPVGFVCLPDAPAAMTERLAQAGLRQISPQEASETDGHVIVLGIGKYNSRLPGVTYYHSLYGVETEMLFGRAGRFVFSTGGYLLETGLEVLAALQRNLPITRSQVQRWRERLLAWLGGDCPAARAAGRRLHTGEVHCHTNYSDGAGTPGGILLEAALCGMDFLILTDHGTTLGAEKLTQTLEQSRCGFPFIVGEEITRSRAYHLNCFPLKSFISPFQPYRKLLEETHRQGALVMLNHPMTYGINLRKFWYGDFKGTGLDAIERRIENLDRWRKTGTAPVVMGSTDSHRGIFGFMERSVILADEPGGTAVVDAIRSRKAGMIAPDLAQYIVADQPVVEAARAALGDDQLPEAHAKRLTAAFANANLAQYLQNSPDGSDAKVKWDEGDPNEVILPLDG